MAYGYGGAGTLAESLDATSGAGGISCALPAGWGEGELLVIQGATRPTFGGEFNTPAGWIVLGASNDLTMKFFGRKATASESAPTLTMTAAKKCAVRMTRWTGAPATINTIVHNSGITQNTGGGYDFLEDIVTAAMSVTEDNTLILYGANSTDGIFVPGTWPNGCTPAYNDDMVGGGDLGMVLGYQVQGTATDVPASIFDSSSVLTARSTSIVLSLRALADATPMPPGRRYFRLP